MTIAKKLSLITDVYRVSKDRGLMRAQYEATKAIDALLDEASDALPTLCEVERVELARAMKAAEKELRKSLESVEVVS